MPIRHRCDQEEDLCSGIVTHSICVHAGVDVCVCGGGGGGGGS